MAYCRKGGVCIALNKPSLLKSDIDIPVKENFDFAAAVDSVYPLTEIIFSYLDYKSLQTVSQVTKSWQLAANRVLERRNKLSWITVFRRRRLCFVHNSHNFLNHRISAGIILFNYRQISLSDLLCYHENLSKTRVKHFLADQVVPGDVNYCIIGCPGVDSIFTNLADYKYNSSLFDGCFLPTIQNVKVSLFYFTPDKVSNCIEHNEELKCLLIFTKFDLRARISTLLHELMPKKFDVKSVALGGGVIQKTMLFPPTVDSNISSTLCIAFTQNINKECFFNAFSIVIEGNLTSEEFEKELRKFKNGVVLRNNSLAFRFCCTAKLQKRHESRIFNNLFPHTSLLGLHAEGEIGWNTYKQADIESSTSSQEPGNDDCLLRKTYGSNSDSSDEDSASDNVVVKKMYATYPKSQHQWSTVIVLITWD